MSCSFGPETPNLEPSAADRSIMWNETRFYRKAVQPMVDKGMLIVAAAGKQIASSWGG